MKTITASPPARYPLFTVVRPALVQASWKRIQAVGKHHAVFSVGSDAYKALVEAPGAPFAEYKPMAKRITDDYGGHMTLPPLWAEWNIGHLLDATMALKNESLIIHPLDLAQVIFLWGNPQCVLTDGFFTDYMRRHHLALKGVEDTMEAIKAWNNDEHAQILLYKVVIAFRLLRELIPLFPDSTLPLIAAAMVSKKVMSIDTIAVAEAGNTVEQPRDALTGEPFLAGDAVAIVRCLVREEIAASGKHMLIVPIKVSGRGTVVQLKQATRVLQASDGHHTATVRHVTPLSHPLLPHVFFL
jgi:hypothetical protein